MAKIMLNGVDYSAPTASGVSGVKGNAETDYRTGNVNITPANIGLENVGNFKSVSTESLQGLSDTEKENARLNIGAGTSNFSGNYNDLSGKPPAIYITFGEIVWETQYPGNISNRSFSSTISAKNHTIYRTHIEANGMYIPVSDGWVNLFRPTNAPRAEGEGIIRISNEGLLVEGTERTNVRMSESGIVQVMLPKAIISEYNVVIDLCIDVTGK